MLFLNSGLLYDDAVTDGIRFDRLVIGPPTPLLGILVNCDVEPDVNFHKLGVKWTLNTEAA
jgi:hypothetical protein